MKHLMIKVAAGLALSAAALLCNQARANTVTWTFLENGTGASLGTSSTFVESGYSITAYGFKVDTPPTPSALFAKFTSGDPGETGLGMVNDVGGDHEIDKSHFIQLDSVISPPATVGSILLGSIQGQEDGAVYGSNTLGALGTWLATIGADGTINLSSWASTYRYFGVTDVGTKSAGNTLISSLSATTSVPDGGTTALLLGVGLLGVGFAARRLRFA